VPSPNYWEGRSGFDIKYIVMHGTAGDAQPSLNWLTNPASTASVHYLVDRQGTVYQLVNEANAAWGNGIPEQGSVFLGGPNPNYFTISIEHERNVDNTSPITPEQQAASTALVANIRRRHGNLPLIPHSAISPLSPRDALADEGVTIRVTGTPAGSKVTFTARMVDANGRRWASRCVYGADSSGAVDVAQQAPLSGSYTSVDPVGLIWSMRCVHTHGPSSMFLAPAGPLEITFAAQVAGAEPVTVAVIRRWRAAPVTRVDIRQEGVIGTLFEPPGATRTAATTRKAMFSTVVSFQLGPS
jgi:hypothetical protein